MGSNNPLDPTLQIDGNSLSPGHHGTNLHSNRSPRLPRADRHSAGSEARNSGSSDRVSLDKL